MISAANSLHAVAVLQQDSEHEHASAAPDTRPRIKELTHHALTEVRRRVTLQKKLNALGDVALALAVEQIQTL